MLKWWNNYSESSKQTKYFVWSVIVYTLIIVGTTIYCYVRLDFKTNNYAETPKPKLESRRK